MATALKGPLRNRDNGRSDDREWFGKLPSGENEICKYENEFIRSSDYIAADWVITSTEDGSSSNSTIALSVTADCGQLIITPGIADDDSESMQQSNDGGTNVLVPQRLDAGKNLWYETRIALLDADQQDVFVGIAIGDTTPLVTADRLGFQITDGAASIFCISEKSTSETSTDSGVDAVDATEITLGFRWNGSTVEFYVNRAKVATHTADNPDDVDMGLTIYTANGEAGANTLTVDYIYCAQERQTINPML